MPNLASTLDSILSAQGNKDTYLAYKEVLHSLFSHPSTLRAEGPLFLSHLAQDTTGLIISRPLVSEFLDLIHTASDQPTKKALYSFVIQCLSPRLVSFEEQVSSARERLASIFEEEQNWEEAAQTLIAIPLDSGHRVVNEEYKLKTYIQIVRLLLASKDAVAAETYLNRAGLILHPNHAPTLHYTYKQCHAQILDTKKKFLDAALKYYELSLVKETMQASPLFYLHQSVICALLANAGPPRSKLLATLYKDERVHQLPTHVHHILEKMHLSRILKPTEVHEFTQTLIGHHAKEESTDGSTALQHALIQHNLLSASLVYTSISFEQLGYLLDITPQQAEHIASKMILEGRLQGQVDQIDGFVDFPSKHPMRTWDQRIAHVCHQMDDVIETITVNTHC